MSDYSLPMFDDPRNWIKNARKKNMEWDSILLANKHDKEGLVEFLANQVDDNFWPELEVKDWEALVSLQQDSEEKTKFIELSQGTALIYDPKQDNAVTIPMDEYSSWQLYRKKLLKDGFKKESVDEIERATLKILKRLSNDTRESGPIKGLVIGNVQSGKTANMAALMAMAADWGWNMFIILSGTIENLRLQTQTRLFNDLNQTGNVAWRALEHLGKNVDISQKAQSLHFEEKARDRYFTVCLKNSTRLKNLIQWAQADSNKQRQMKILVIDDEADQAGINTGHVDEDERKKINALLCSLVNGKDENGHDIDTQYQAMNYIGYTATPYANILNESGEESLYPRNFISTLAVSKEYFGPQHIFGYSGEAVEFEGMDIVRTIEEDELNDLRNIHNGDSYETPKALFDAISWFLCGVGCMRIWGYKKPISMLVHTSQKTAHHQNIADVINEWFSTNTTEQIIKKAKNVWDIETSRFTFDDFRRQYPDYDRSDDEINQYPAFEEVEKEIRVLLGDGISNIKLDDEGDLSYHKGIHLCIDNCMNNGITEDGYHVRLAYPEPSKMPSPAPAFIVIGGATLSRGLTLEGLFSTFFIRSVGQADTLMQMGRWFGYRKNYELLPRVWMTQKTKEQFEFLAALDQELRDEIQYMDVNGRSPSEYGPKVKNSPKVSFIRITAKNRMQSATPAEMDYSGASNQTYLFDDDPDILEQNIENTMDFLYQLGDEWVPVQRYPHQKNVAIWRNVSFNRIRSYIEMFKFQKRLSVFNDTKPLLDWLQEMTDTNKLGDWNVIVAGKSEPTNGTWELPNGTVINKVKRSRKCNQTELDNGIINIGVLRGPADLVSDIDLDSISNAELRAEIEDFLNHYNAKGAMAYRDKSGLQETPQLIIYRIDKDSKAKENTLRLDLDAPEDLIGLCLYIPGGRKQTSYATTVSIKMSNDVFDGDADLEDIDAD